MNTKPFKLSVLSTLAAAALATDSQAAQLTSADYATAAQLISQQGSFGKIKKGDNAKIAMMTEAMSVIYRHPNAVVTIAGKNHAAATNSATIVANRAILLEYFNQKAKNPSYTPEYMTARAQQTQPTVAKAIPVKRSVTAGIGANLDMPVVAKEKTAKTTKRPGDVYDWQFMVDNAKKLPPALKPIKPSPGTYLQPKAIEIK